MAAPTVLNTIDVNAAQEQARSSYNAKSSGSSFDNVLNTASYAAGVFGPVATESVFAATGNMQTTSIVSAAMNATAGGGYGMSPLGMRAGTMGGVGATNYLTGGSTAGMGMSAGAGAGAGGPGGNVEDIINQSYMNQSYLLAVQSELGNIQTQTTSLSNALNVKDGAMRSVINNFRVG